MKGKIQITEIERLQPGEELHDEEIAGFIARCLPSGLVTYNFRYRLPGRPGRPKMSLGTSREVTPTQARKTAKRYAGMVADGKDPATEREEQRQATIRDETKTVNAVLDAHVKAHVEANLGEETADAIKSAFDRLVRPKIGARLIYDLKRPDLLKLRDEIGDDNGKVMADRTMAYLRKAFNWQEQYEEEWTNPIPKGIALVAPSESRGERDITENDHDLRDIWNASFRLDAVQPRAGQWVRALLLAGQRRTNTAKANSSQVTTISEHHLSGPPPGDYWNIPRQSMRKKKGLQAGERHKSDQTQVVPITAAMRSYAGFERKGGYFFSATEGEKVGLNSFSEIKAEMDRQIAAVRRAEGRKAIEHWTYNDLRRACRTLASRYTTKDIGERLIGHARPNVEATYDKYAFAAEKLAALNAVADHILRVVHDTKPPAKKTGNIIQLRGRASRTA